MRGGGLLFASMGDKSGGGEDEGFVPLGSVVGVHCNDDDDECSKGRGGLVLVGRGVVAVATAVEGRCNSTLPVVSDGSVDGCLAAGDVAAVDVAGWLPR